jgi:hypothetical protein
VKNHTGVQQKRDDYSLSSFMSPWIFRHLPPSRVPYGEGVYQRFPMQLTMPSPEVGFVCEESSPRSLCHGLGRRVNNLTMPLLPVRSLAGASSASIAPPRARAPRTADESGSVLRAPPCDPWHRPHLLEQPDDPISA